MVEKGLFYFIDDSYYDKFTDSHIMKNKEEVNGFVASRPFFFAVEDLENEQISWLIPVSSQVNKYKILYQKKIKRYGYCDTLDFGEVLGRKAVFLIQNMIPITEKYISQPYIQKSTGLYVKIDIPTTKRVTNKARAVLAKHNRGINLIFPDVDFIKSELLKDFLTV